MEKYKLSKFNIYVKCNSKPDYFIIYNTLNSSVGLLSCDNLNNIKQRSKLNNIVLNNLYNKGIIVDENYNENNLFNYWYNRIKFDNSTVYTTILSTYECNMNCPYCNQTGVVEKSENNKMNNKVADSVINWVKKIAKDKRAKNINIGFFGGEPLLNLEPIYFISSKIIEFVKDNNMSYEFSLCTNGYLLTEETIIALKDHGINLIQVSIDGSKDVHNSRRFLKGGILTYDVIYNNIKNALINNMKINIAINLDKGNINSYKDLLIDLTKLPNKNLLYLSLGLIKDPYVHKKYCAIHNVNYLESPNIYISAIKLAKEYGFNVGNAIGFGVCTFEGDSCYVIDPKGDLYNCVFGVGLKEFKIGSLLGPYGIIFENIAKLKTTKKQLKKECYDCSFLPLCRGGCYYLALCNEGNVEKNYCRYDNLKNTVEPLISLIYEDKLLKLLDKKQN